VAHDTRTLAAGGRAARPRPRDASAGPYANSPRPRLPTTLRGMAVRGWGASVATAIAAAAGAGAAQLGLGYGLGIIVWLPSADDASEATWVASLAWALWIAATSTVAGAICADRLFGPVPSAAHADRPSSAAPLATALGRTVLAVASAIGALVNVALVAVPARAATRADTFSPQTIAAGYAVLGVLLGLATALWALSSRAVARNVMATVGWLWLLAVVAIIDGVLSGRGLAAAQLGVWQITDDSERFWFRDHFYWPGAALSLGSALVIGALAVGPAARRSSIRVGAAVSGGAGPLLVAAAYFLAAPRLVGIRAEQLSAHLIAPYAVIAGIAGSVIVAAVAQRAEHGPPWGRLEPRPGGVAARPWETGSPVTAGRPVTPGRPAQPSGPDDTPAGAAAPPAAAVPPRADEPAGRDPVLAPDRTIVTDHPEPTGRGSSS
jgi:hypothetical protein